MIEKNLDKKICNYCKEYQKGIYDSKQDIILFLKQEFDIDLDEKCKLKEINEILYEKLTPETMDKYYNFFKKFGLTRYGIKETTNLLTDYLITKLQKNDKISVVHSYKSDYHDTYVYSIKDILLLTNEDIKTRKQARAEINDDNIAEALYIINKSAKISRDTKVNAYEYGDYRICKCAKTRQNNLYNLKDKTLKKLNKQNKLTLIGIHKQIINGQTNYLKLYQFKDYTFHIPIMKEQIPKDAKILEDILEEKIPSEKQKTKLTYNQAVQVLKDFLK